MINPSLLNNFVGNYKKFGNRSNFTNEYNTKER
jgi:hypothetical protein